MTPEQARALASEFKLKSQVPNTSKDCAFIMRNIARSFVGLATQLDMLASKTREEAAKGTASL